MRRLRIFVPSAAALLTDSAGHGEGLAAWRLLSGLAARGHEIVACANVVTLEREAPFDVHEVGPAARLESLEPLASARRARRLLERLGGAARFDVVHWLFPNTAHAVLFHPPRGLPYVIGPHTAPWPSRTRALRAGDAVRIALRPLFGVLHERALAAASALLFETDRGARMLPARHAAKAHVVSGGVDAARFEASPLPPGQRVLFVGRLERAKGVRELVDAFARVHAELAGSELVLAGDGPERSWVERRCRELGLNGSVRLLGRVANDDVPHLLRDATVFCLPSIGEPYGYSALEAMAAARPVVVRDDGGPAEYVDPLRGGRVVRGGNGEALARALVDVLANREAAERMGEFNRRRVVEELQTERMLDRLENVYEEVLAR